MNQYFYTTIEFVNLFLLRKSVSLLFFSLLIGTIQGQNVSYVTINDDNTFNRAIDQSKVVGAIPGSAGVTPAGGASYNIPIAVPPGTNGLAPQLALTYNSQTGNGVAGYGWGVAGGSSIIRVQKNWYNDDKVVSPITFTNSDAFALDGQRLVLIGGGGGFSGREYRTEDETFVRIRTNSGFVVETKDGLRKEYGLTWDSRVLSNDGAVLEYKLNKIQDNFGNYMLFKYSNLITTSSNKNGQNCLTEIHYTGNGNTGQIPYNKVLFSYKVRDDKNVYYQSGTALPTEYVVDKISVYGESNTLFKIYQLNYAKNGLYSVLNDIVEVGSDGSLLNSTIFKYGTTATDFEHLENIDFQPMTQDINASHVCFPGDFNGDGYTDVLVSTYSPPFPNVTYNNDFKIYKHDPNTGGFVLGAQGNFPGNFNISTPDYMKLRNFRGFISTDYDGDGSNDFIGLIKENSNELKQISIYKITNDANNYTILNIPAPTNYRFIHSSGNFFYLGDFDGDSRVDYITILGSNIINNFGGRRYQAFISFPALGQNNIPLPFSDEQSLYNNTYRVLPIADANKIYAMDFDGDGKLELMSIKDNITTIYSIERLGNNYKANVLHTLNYPTNSHIIDFGDFNGDKKVDILTKSSGDGWRVGYNTGSGLGFAPQSIDLGVNYSSLAYGADPNKKILADYNGDGKTDILLSTRGNNGTTINMRVFFSNGIDFKAQDFFHNVSSANIVDEWYPFDLNGDGQEDILRYEIVVSPWPPIASYNSFMFHPNSKKHLLEKISDGMNERYEFDYALLTSGSPFYNRTMNSSFPMNVSRAGVFMVSSFKKDNGNGGMSTSRYQYANALLHRAGRGFMGFLSTTRTDETMGTITTQEYDLNTTFYATALRKTTTCLIGGQPLRQTYNENDFKSLGGKRFYVKVPFAKERNLLGGSTKFIYNVFDDNSGTILSTSSLDGQELSNTTTVYTNVGVPFHTKPKIVTTTVSRGSSTVTTITNMEYYNNGALKNKKELVGTDCEVKTDYMYYSFGGLRREYTHASGLPNIINEYTYETKGRFQRFFTNTNGQTTEYTYHPLWGKVLTYKGIDQLTTSYTYDGFGRMTTAAIPQGYTVGASCGWDVQNTRVYFVLNTHPGKPDVKTWYDKLGREVQQQTEGFNGNLAIATTQYDGRGNVFKKTKPHFQNGETILSSTYVHDAYNRLSNVITNTGAYAYDYAYSSGNLTTTFTNEAGQITTQTTDPTGKVISATDPNGTLNYTYDGFGNILTVKSGSTVLVQNTYNNCGQKKQMTDKNAGTTNYVYNAYGQLKSQTNPIGFQNYTYNNLGQVLTKNINEGQIAYTYVTNPSGINQVKTITINYNNGYTHGQEFLYDGYSRPTTVKETIDGSLFSKTITYNAYDDPTQIAYNSGLTLKRQYDANGYLQSIAHSNTPNTTPIYTVNTMNGLGQCTEYTLGNGKTSTTTYENGLPTHFYTDGIQDLQLGIDFTNGNITSRHDAIKNLTENFTYDDNERLLSAQVGNLTALTMAYANNGNITSKTDVGYYSYNSSKINAVKMVSNPNTVVPNQAQNVLYSSFSQPIEVTEHAKELAVFYGADGQRRKSVLIDSASGNPIWVRYYFGDYERQTIYGGEQASTQNVHYINGLNGLVGIATMELSGDPTFHYTYTDHLGSILTVTNDNSIVEAEQNFDPWGRTRNYKNWTYTILSDAPDYLPTPNWLYRGFTGHEHLPEFNLINMNGRMYDPLLARMLSPDNYVQDLFSSQSFNRYTYCLNNPLKYTDPSGEEFVFQNSDGMEYGRARDLGGLTRADWGFGSDDDLSAYWGDWGASLNAANAEWAWADTKAPAAEVGTGGFDHLHMVYPLIASNGSGLITTPGATIVRRELKDVIVEPKKEEKVVNYSAVGLLALSDGPEPFVMDAVAVGYLGYLYIGNNRNNSYFTLPTLTLAVARGWSYLSQKQHYTYEHPSQNPIHRKPYQGVNPKDKMPDFNNAVKWLMGGLGAYRIYKGWTNRMEEIKMPPYYSPPKDNTNVTKPQFIPHP